MRITRDLLLSTAKDTVHRATLGGHDLVCVYITGSLVNEDPLIGGATDIDMIYVHSIETPTEQREIIPLTEDFHLDIAHLHESTFSQPRQLRTDPWVGSFLCHYPIPLYDSDHWFEYVQASVYAHFYQPSNIIQRVKPFSGKARNTWLQLQTAHDQFNIETISLYVNSIKDAANAISCLVSVPLTNRRFLIDFPARTQELHMPGLASGLIDLIVPEDPIEPAWDAWLADWRSDFSLLQSKTTTPIDFQNGRLSYYEKAIHGLRDNNQEAALWILLWSWSKIAATLSKEHEISRPFQDFCQVLMLGEGNFENRVTSLDGYLDVVEETIERWQNHNGI